MTKLFIGKLSFSSTPDSLSAHFEQFGPLISAKIITDKETGRSRGFAFIEIDSDDRAQDAIQQLNGSTLDGREIVVSEARPQESRDGGRGGFRSFGNDRSDGGFRRNQSGGYRH